MGLSQRSSLGSRGLAVVFGVLCVVGLSLPAAWSTVAADDQSSLGAGIYPAAYAITGRQDRDGSRQDRSIPARSWSGAG